jgi:hypothetical protein
VSGAEELRGFDETWRAADDITQAAAIPAWMFVATC